jgi:hypothetical protein
MRCLNNPNVCYTDSESDDENENMMIFEVDTEDNGDSSDDGDYVPLDAILNPNAGEQAVVGLPNAPLDDGMGVDYNEMENWDVPLPHMPNPVQVFLDAHPSGVGLCLTNAELETYRNFNNTELRTVRDAWIGSGDMCTFVYRVFRTHPENQPLCVIHRTGEGEIEDFQFMDTALFYIKITDPALRCVVCGRLLFSILRNREQYPLQ